MKKWISTIVLILLAAYIVVAVVAFSDKPANQECGGIRLHIVDSAEVAYMTTKDVQVLLADLIPTAQKMGFRIAECCPQLETNNKALSVWRSLDTEVTKKRHTWKKSL